MIPSPSKMKYDIPSLLALSQNGSIDIGKFSVHALENNLLSRRRASTNVLTERTVNRSRVASSFSAAHSEESPFTSGGPLQYPSRQPRNAPHGNLAQTDAGFARFLKEHASPKHHRVTAGGRIVPMNPEAPAPEFKLSMKKQEVSSSAKIRRSEAATERSSGTQAASEQDAHGNTNANVIEFSSISGTLPGVAAPFPAFDGPGPEGRILGSQQTVSTVQNSFIQPHLAVPENNTQTAQPTYMHQEYMTFAPNHGAYTISADQINWLPNNNPLPAQKAPTPFMTASTPQPAPGPISPFGVPVGSIPGMFPPGNTLKLPSSAPIYPLVGMSSNPVLSPIFPTMNSSLLSMAPAQEPAIQKSLQDASRQHETLSAQLSSIDRYMALHNWDLDPSSKKILVEQRMHLVRELDATRLYKEQLDSNLRQQNLTSTDGRSVCASGFESMYTSIRPGDASCNANMPSAPWFPSLAASNTPPVWTPTTVQSTFTSILPTNESLNASFPSQFPTIGCMAPMHAAFVYGDLRSNAGVAYGDQLPHPDWAVGVNQDMNIQTRHGFSTESSEIRDPRTDNDGWTTPTQSAPPEISQIYCRIEEAAKHGEPIEELLKELTAVTTKLSQLRIIGHATLGLDSHGNGSLFKRQDKTEYVGGTVNGTEAVYSSKQPLQTSGGHGDKRRSRKSGQSITQSLGRGYQGSQEVEDDDDGKSCYSCLSTTDSWATIQEGDKRWLAREAAKANEKGNNELKDDDEGIFDSGNRRGRSGLANRALNIRNTVEWIQNIDHDDSLTHEPRNASLSNTSSNPGSQEDAKPRNSRTCPLWKRKQGQGHLSKKGCASALPQKVNAYGFLPPFDGPGDLPDTGASSSSADNHVGDGHSRPSDAHRPNSAQYPWYIKRVRDKPSVDEVRDFFRRLEEDEQQMIHKYQIGYPRV